MTRDEMIADRLIDAVGGPHVAHAQLSYGFWSNFEVLQRYKERSEKYEILSRRIAERMFPEN